MPASEEEFFVCFQSHAVDMLGPLASEFGFDHEFISPSTLKLTSFGATVEIRLKKGYVWYVTVVIAPNNNQSQAPGAVPSEERFAESVFDGVSGFVALAYVLQALTEGGETFSPKWIKSESELVVELERLKSRLIAHGHAIFRGEIDWEKARDYMRMSIDQGIAAVSGRSRKAQLARKLEAAEDMYGQDELGKAKELYEEIADQLGAVELLRLERLRRQVQP